MMPVSLVGTELANRERPLDGVPRLPRDLLERRALLDRLHASVGNGLTILQAPAGFGKTTLAAAFAREVEREFETRWLAVDATCDTQEAFADRLARVVLGGEAWAPVSITLGEDFRTYLAGILARWQEQCATAPLLVLDCLDQLSEDAPAWWLIEWVVEFMRDRGEVVLVSRRPLARRAIDRRVAGGEAAVFGPEDLAFTREEVAELCRRAGSDADPAELFEATGGWPIAVMGVLRGAIPLDRARRRSIGRRSWERYLATEVWRSVPESVRPTLLRLSVVPDCDENVGASLVGRERWEEAVRWAAESGFLVDSREGGMRFAPLFRELLLSELRKDAQEAEKAAEDAVGSYLASGNPTSALAVATDLGAEKEVRRLLRSTSQELIDRGAFDLLSRAFELLEEGSVVGDPELRALRARAWSLAGKPERALEEATAIFEDTSAPVEARFHAGLAAVRAARLLGKGTEALRWLDRTRELEPLLEGPLSAELQWHYAHALMALRSDFGTAEVVLSALASGDSGRPAFSLLASSALGQLYGMRGDVPLAVECLSRAAAGWRQLGGTGNLPWVLNNLSMAHLAAGDVNAAQAAAWEAVEEARRTGNLRALAYATASLAESLLTAGRPANAKQAYKRALKLCEEQVADDTLATLVIAGLAAAAAANGELIEADVYARRAQLMADALGSPFEVATCRLAVAAVAAANGDPAHALELSAEAASLARAIGAEGLLRTALYRAAMSAFRGRRRTEAAAYLRELAGCVRESWHVAPLGPLVREDPLFAQWVANKPEVPSALREAFTRLLFRTPAQQDKSFTRTEYPVVRVESLGRVAVYRDGQEVPHEAFASSKALEFLLIFLAHRDGISKDRVVTYLYPDLDQEKCNSAFHSNLYRVRKALYQDCIVKRGIGTYSLNPLGEFQWDVDEFRDLLRRARAAPQGSKERARLFEAAVRYYEGPFAATVHSEWAATLRAELDQQAVEALATLAGYHAGRGEFEEAAQCLERVLEMDPLNDEAAYHLARFKAQAGQVMAALTVIDRFAEVMQRELGEEIPERLLRLRRAIATGATG